jgi:hypothetical protein
LTTEQKARVVVLAGFVASGKTTLLCCLYQQYQTGAFAGTLFAGSRCLRAFEELSHENRAGSGREVPETARTPRGQTGYLNLRLRSDASEYVEVLFSDLSGEPYGDVISTPTNAGVLPGIGRADTVALIVDGSTLIAPGERDIAAYRVRILLRALLEHGGLRSDADVDVVLTKWDLVAKAGDEAAQEARRTIAELAEMASRQHDSASFVTCGRSLADARVETGSGIDLLIRRWCRHKSPPVFGLPQENVIPVTT